MHRKRLSCDGSSIIIIHPGTGPVYALPATFEMNEVTIERGSDCLSLVQIRKVAAKLPDRRS
jgi:hypothetical protein